MKFKCYPVSEGAYEVGKKRTDSSWIIQRLLAPLQWRVFIRLRGDKRFWISISYKVQEFAAGEPQSSKALQLRVFIDEPQTLSTMGPQWVHIRRKCITIYAHHQVWFDHDLWSTSSEEKSIAGIHFLSTIVSMCGDVSLDSFLVIRLSRWESLLIKDFFEVYWSSSSGARGVALKPSLALTSTNSTLLKFSTKSSKVANRRMRESKF